MSYPVKLEPKQYNSDGFPDVLEVLAPADRSGVSTRELYDRRRKCTMTRTFHGSPCSDWTCSACCKISNAVRPHERCPRCGAVVVSIVIRLE